MKYDVREPCASCPYRTDARPEFWHPAEFVRLLDTERSQLGVVYGCHEYRKRPNEARVCIGWLLNQRDRGCPSIMLRLALRDPAAAACLNEAHSPVPLYDSVEEMCSVNGVDSE